MLCLIKKYAERVLIYSNLIGGEDELHEVVVIIVSISLKLQSRRTPD